MKKTLTIILLLILVLVPSDTFAKNINLYLFYGKECLHCEKEIKFLDTYLKDNDELTLYKYEVWHDSENKDIMNKSKKLLNQETDSVPYLVIGKEAIIGFRENVTENKIKKIISFYQENNYCDVLGEELGIVDSNENCDEYENNTFNIPFIGEVGAKDISLPLIAMIIGFVDGFNPCAMWVLLFLITMLFGMKDKKKMWILGLTFLVSSALIYLLFMVSWLNLAILTSRVVLIRVLIGMFALVFGTINIYKYLKSKNEKDVGCEVTNDTKRKKIMTRIKRIVKEEKFILAILGIIVLAVMVNAIELLCSLGLPLMFTQILSLNNLSTAKYAFNIFIYILFFMIDDIIIFIIAMKTLEIKAISNKYAKYSHLIGGIIMVFIGILMIFKPEWLMLNF